MDATIHRGNTADRDAIWHSELREHSIMCELKLIETWAKLMAGVEPLYAKGPEVEMELVEVFNWKLHDMSGIERWKDVVIADLEAEIARVEAINQAS